MSRDYEFHDVYKYNYSGRAVKKNGDVWKKLQDVSEVTSVGVS